MVSEQIFIWTVLGLVSGGLIIAGGVWHNRRKLTRLWQRLFGLHGDGTDGGHIENIEMKVDNIQDEIEENQEEIQKSHRKLQKTIDKVEESLNGD